MWRSTRDFRQDLFESYRSSKLQRAKTLVPFGREIIGYQAKARKKPRRQKNVSSALRVLDDLMLDAILWHHSFVMALWNEKRLLDPSLRKCLLALLMRITQDAIVVRNLINDGYDVQARNLLRSLDEHMDAVYYLCLKPELSVEFLKTEDDDLANKFWWEHIRKARKSVDAAIQQKINLDPTLDAFSAFKTAERAMLSTAHHPSYAATTVPFLVPYEGVSVSEYIFGVPSEYSYRTGKLLFYVLAEAVLCMSLLNGQVHKLIGRKGNGPIQKVVRTGAQHVVTMLSLLIQNWDSPLFKTTPEMEEFWRSLPS